MSRLTYLTGLALVVLCGAFLLTDALVWAPGVTEANVRRVRLGMTVAEVEALLGERAAPGPWASSGPVDFGDVSRAFRQGQAFGVDWVGPTLDVRVWFDRSGQVLLVERSPDHGRW